MIEIRNRWSNEVIFKSETATTVKMAVEEAVKKKANLCEADLWKADLSEADLSEADLWEANLRKANLYFCKMDKKVFKQITEGWFEWKIIDEEKEGKK